MASDWYFWNASGTTSAITTASSTWNQWTSATTTSATTASTIWVDWVGGTCSNKIYAQEYHEPVKRSAEDLARMAREQNEREAKFAAERDAERELRIAAEAKAEKLLLENLTLKQREEYKKDKLFVVHGRSGRRYRIRPQRTGNVDVIDRFGKIEHRLCAHTREDIPIADNMLAQKLMLEHDEHYFLHIANRHSSFGNQEVVLPALS